MHIEDTPLEGVKLLTPARFGDDRGFFSESYSKRVLAEHGIAIDFVQDNHSFSTQVGTLRGLHCQAPPSAQDKLIRCGRGRIFDVAVDIRVGSPTYGEWFGAELSFENGRQLLVPQGFLHGVLALEPETEIVYKCSNFFDPQADRAVHWDSCGIDWNFDGAPVLSDKDKTAPPLRDFESPFTYEGPFTHER